MPALTATPLFSLLAAAAFLLAGRCYEADKASAGRTRFDAAAAPREAAA
ncbi:MAG: hypothetical protein U1F25_16960 [Rubrivivax sp.]